MGLFSMIPIVGDALDMALDLGVNEWQKDKDRDYNADMMRENLNTQLRNNKEMAELNRKNAMRMWNDTGVSEQMKIMKREGLNPAMMYGGGGAGGATTSMPSQGAGGGGSASYGAQPIDLMSKMAMQAQMRATEAQTELTEAQTEKTNAEAEKIAGVDTEVGKATVESLTQGVENSKAQEALTRVQGYIAEMTKEEQIGQIGNLYQKSIEEVNQAQIQTHINGATAEDKIKIIRQEAIGAVLENEQRRGNINLTEAQISKIKTEISNMINDNIRNWERLSLDERRLQIEERLKQEGLDIEKVRLLVDGIGTVLSRGTKQVEHTHRRVD